MVRYRLFMSRVLLSKIPVRFAKKVQWERGVSNRPLFLQCLAHHHVAATEDGRTPDKAVCIIEHTP